MSISCHSGICIVPMCSASTCGVFCSHFAVTEENNDSLRQAGSEVAGYKEVQGSNTRCKAQYCRQQDGYLRTFLVTTFWWTYVLGLANLFLIVNCNYIVYVFLIVWIFVTFPLPFVNLEANLRLTVHCSIVLSLHTRSMEKIYPYKITIGNYLLLHTTTDYYDIVHYYNYKNYTSRCHL